MVSNNILIIFATKYCCNLYCKDKKYDTNNTARRVNNCYIHTLVEYQDYSKKKR